jgi:hypothetical protein
LGAGGREAATNEGNASWAAAAFVAAVELTDITGWVPTITQLRSTILAHRMAGPQFPADQAWRPCGEGPVHAAGGR